MAKYLALQIHKGKLVYDDVIGLYPQFKADVDAELAKLEGEN